MAVQIGHVVVLDDQQFYVCLNETQAPDVACGFLERRCFVSATTPAGFECVGSFFQHANGTWAANISKASRTGEDSDCTVVVDGVGRLDAITALWRARHAAFIGHPPY